MHFQYMQNKQLELDFEIINSSIKKQGYSLVTDTDGCLVMEFGEGRRFVFETVLIVEFAVYCNQWMQKNDENEQEPFYYISMDEEEEPILAFKPQRDGTFTAESCWFDFRVDNITPSQLKLGISKFLEKFEMFTAQTFGRNVESIAAELFHKL